ncbi:hypothetical protein K438DRAFT_1906119 [Mycena galopus ATCC 62051]|nr:hypothetical protein K438DRAFT_1906119 [Mycena galopus ATCC 62051]
MYRRIRTSPSFHTKYVPPNSDKVRVFRVMREGKWHHIVGHNVQALLEGDIQTSYTEADNSVVVAMLVRIMVATISPTSNFTDALADLANLIPERFVLHLGTHLVSRYAHIHKVFVTVEQLRWSRIYISAEQGPEEHPALFYSRWIRRRQANGLSRGTHAFKEKDKITANVTAGISGLLNYSVLKKTESAFNNFVWDTYTTPKELDDRIHFISVDLSYKFAPIEIKSPTDTFIIPDTTVPNKARKVTFETFATYDSASVQATLFLMAQRTIVKNAHVQLASCALPNKHYIAVEINYLGVENVVPFMPIAAPSGLITAIATRK